MESAALTVTPRTAEGADGLAAITRRPGAVLLAFDFDGTLAPIVERPDQVRPLPAALTALRRLGAHVGTLAVITGRPAAVAARLLGADGAATAEADSADGASADGRSADEPSGGPLPLTVLGHYGLERWNPATGRVEAPAPHPGVAEVRAVLPGLLAELAGPGSPAAGATIEEKGQSVAVHTRRCADPVAALDYVDGPLRRLAAEHGLAAEPGRYVLELRPPGVDKGHALAGLAAERSATAVLYAGDDLGDLAAFDAVARLRGEGVPGVTVCSASAETAEVERRADVVVDGPAGVAGFLAELAAAIESHGG